MLERPEKSIDWPILSLFIALVGIGWLSIFTVGYGEGYPSSISGFILNTDVGKQSLWIAIAAVLFFFVYIIEKNFWQTFAYPIFVVSLIALLAVLAFGKEINGAKSWFYLSGFTMQPSEIAKFATCLAVASYASRRGTDFKKFRHQLTVIALFALPMALIMLQPDAGSALVFLAFFFVLYRQGFPALYFAIGFSSLTLMILALLFSPYFIVPGIFLLGLFAILFQFKNKRASITLIIAFLTGSIIAIVYGQAKWLALSTGIIAVLVSLILFVRQRDGFGFRLMPFLLVGTMLVFGANYAMNDVLRPHQQDRINAWLNPSKADRSGSYYNLFQSKLAIGSGGFMGKGFLEGNLTKGKHVPEQSTDFIFCTIGEEQGFLGSASIIVLFLFFLLRIITLAERQQNSFGRSFAYGVAGIFFIHFFVNIGMTMGLVPIIGIPLPFISKGGSALLGFTLLIAVLIKLDRYR